MSKINLNDLEQKAKAATTKIIGCAVKFYYWNQFQESANPDTILALIRVARAAQLAAKYAEAGDVPAHLLEALKEVE